MIEFSLLYSWPIWAAGLFFVVVLALSLEFGYQVVLKRRDKWKDADSGGGAVVLTSMFALMGLVLAFTYASGVSRFDARKNAVMIKANALGTAFLRADLVLTGLMIVILDFDRANEGFVIVNNASIWSVIAEMEAGLGQ